MPHSSPSKETIYYGGSSHRPPVVTELQAGLLTCQYEDGYLRYIRVGRTELLRMIYSAVRDQNWGTVAPTISNEKIENYDDHFLISYDCRYEEKKIDFLASYRIEGKADESIRFTMDGEARSIFQRNRIGFCVLHPASIAGTDCQIESPEGEPTEGKFPVYISPHQPFKNIRQMQWQPSEGITVTLEFVGDVFETEDQRNWTDDSFKTYCTPLALPFPVTIERGTKVHQEVILKLEQIPAYVSTQEKPLRFLVLNETIELPAKLPAIGIGRSTEVSKLTQENTALLKKVRFSHYRVDIHLYELDWTSTWKLAKQESNELGWPLKIALHFSDNVDEEISNFIEVALDSAIESIIVFHRDHKVTPESLLNRTVTKLQGYFADALVGGGTDHFFTELNRDRISTDNLAFLSYSVNPQVHQFDNQSLIETLQAQAYTVESARQFAQGASVHVSPVTLKMRRNPNATESEPAVDLDTLPMAVDTRQASLFGAGWTVGSLRNLIQEGADSITYFETVGRKGIISGDKETSFSELYSALPHAIYPVYLIFRFLLAETNTKVFKTEISDSWQIEGIALENDQGIRAIVANLQPKLVTVQLPENTFTRMKILDENNFASALKQPDTFLETEYSESTTSLQLLPHAIAFLRA